MLTNLLTWFQAVTGGYVTPYGFYLPIGNYTFVFWTDIAIGFFALAALYYWFRFRQASKQKKPVVDDQFRLKGTGSVMKRDNIGIGGKSGASEMVRFPTHKSFFKENAPVTRPHELPSQGKNFYKNMELTLMTAVRTGKEVIIEYINGEGMASERKILPRNLYTRFDKTYLVAWCYLRGEERTFRIDRIFSARFVEYDRDVI